MTQNTRAKRASHDSLVNTALSAFEAGEFSSIRACARAFGVAKTTLRDRLSGTSSSSSSHEIMQNLSTAEEETLARWITRLTRTGYPASPALALEMAEEIRRTRKSLSTTPSSYPTPISRQWLFRFRARHPEISGIWARQIDHARYSAVNVEGIEQWFSAVTALFLENQYAPECIYHMDESGFGVGTSQTSRALINVKEKSSWKVISGRQEWITAIECISASGKALPPLLIFKAKHTNTAWIPPTAPPNWRFSTSNSGWTSNSHAYEWLTTLFDPETKPLDPNSRRLLIMDGHGSHITANVIAYAMENAIDLLILPPHTSHVLQPLDVGVFAPLKRALALETDAASRLDPGRISRVEWTETYIRARERAFTTSTISSGWRASGLWPLSAITVLEKVNLIPTSTPLPPRTPISTTPLDLLLLNSSPPDGTELRRANAALNAELEASNSLTSPVKRYITKMARAYELTHSELTTTRKEVVAQRELLRVRKNRKKGKRISLKGRFVFSTQEVLEIAKQAEEETAQKKTKKSRNSRTIVTQIEEEEENIDENQSSESEDDCIIVASRASL